MTSMWFYQKPCRKNPKLTMCYSKLLSFILNQIIIHEINSNQYFRTLIGSRGQSTLFRDNTYNTFYLVKCTSETSFINQICFFIYPFEILSQCHILSYRSLVMKFSNKSGNIFIMITKAERFKLSDVLNNSHALNNIF